MQGCRVHQIRSILRSRKIIRVTHVLCAFILILCLAVPALASKKRSSQKKKSSAKRNYPTSSENYLVNEMLRHLGTRYRSGGTSPTGLDCSGYVGLVYRNAYGMDLPHQSGSLFVSSELEKVRTGEIRTGDLLFFTSSRKSKRINHVGIYLSEGRFVHAASGKGVTVSGLDEQYWSERYAGARRVTDLPHSKGGYETVAFSTSGYGDVLELESGRDISFASHSLGLEFGKEKPLQVSLFQDSLFPSRSTYGDEFLYSERMGLEGRPSSSYVQGVKFERDLRPLPWVVVTPSLSYYSYEGRLDDTLLPKRSVGVDLSLVSKEDGWRISTGFRYLSLIPPKGLSEENPTPQGFDMSLTYSKRVSDVLSVSLTGERFQRADGPRSDLLQPERSSDDQRFSVMFSFSY